MIPSSLLPGGQLARFHGDDSAVPAGAGVDGQDGPEQPQQVDKPARIIIRLLFGLASD